MKPVMLKNIILLLCWLYAGIILTAHFEGISRSLDEFKIKTIDEQKTEIERLKSIFEQKSLNMLEEFERDSLRKDLHTKIQIHEARIRTNSFNSSRLSPVDEMRYFMHTDDYKKNVLSLFEKNGVGQDVLDKLYDLANVSQDDIEKLQKLLSILGKAVGVTNIHAAAFIKFGEILQKVLKNEVPELHPFLQEKLNVLQRLSLEKQWKFCNEIIIMAKHNPRTTFFLFLVGMAFVGIILNSVHNHDLKNIGAGMMMTSISILAVWSIGRISSNSTSEYTTNSCIDGAFKLFGAFANV